MPCKIIETCQRFPTDFGTSYYSELNSVGALFFCLFASRSDSIHCCCLTNKALAQHAYMCVCMYAYTLTHTYIHTYTQENMHRSPVSALSVHSARSMRSGIRLPTCLSPVELMSLLQLRPLTSGTVTTKISCNNNMEV